MPDDRAPPRTVSSGPVLSEKYFLQTQQYGGFREYQTTGPRRGQSPVVHVVTESNKRPNTVIQRVWRMSVGAPTVGAGAPMVGVAVFLHTRAESNTGQYSNKWVTGDCPRWGRLVLSESVQKATPVNTVIRGHWRSSAVGSAGIRGIRTESNNGQSQQQGGTGSPLLFPKHPPVVLPQFYHQYPSGAHFMSHHRQHSFAFHLL